VDASVTFTTGLDSLIIRLQDIEANPKDVAQALSDLRFNIVDGSLAGATLTSSSAQEITIDKLGTSALGTKVSTGWSFGESGGGTIGVLDVLGTKSGPAHLIIGPAGNGGVYGNANGSIAGNSPHNPFLDESATFVITAPGITADTTITAATFAFGTTPGVDLVQGVPLGHISAVPEPNSLILSTISFALFGLFRFCYSRRRRKRVA
jgi:hypothetical protein